MRIVSLLPSTTEIVAALGKQRNLVGRSHECGFPDEITALPVCTVPKFEADGTSYEIDQRVKALLQEGLSVYRVDKDQLADLNPDIIITQDHCEVCAASVDDVKQAVRSQLGDHVEILSVSPTDLSEVVNSIRTIGEAIGAAEEADRLLAQMKSYLQQIQDQIVNLRQPDVLPIEWLNPLMSAGNWVPELIQIAGGNPLEAKAGEHSPWLEWRDLQKANPDIIAIMPCGYSINQTLTEIYELTDHQSWGNLRAVRNKQVYLVDGNQYFNRPGPRLVDSARILAEIIHPSVFREEKPPSGWINLANHQFQQKVREL